MKIKIIAIHLLATAVLTGCADIESARGPAPGSEKQQVADFEEKGKTIPAKVISVTDGDTIKVELENGLSEKVRLILVDTPESRGKYEGNPQPFGKESSDFTRKHLEGKDVELEPWVEERDRYGRMLAYIWIDGKLFNEQLLENGLARVAVYPPNTKYLDSFERTEEQAQQDNKNIWSLEDYASENGFEEKREAEIPDSGTREVFDPNGEDRDCGDFKSHEEAQAFFEAAGPGDPHRLDRDGDGFACDK
ncbi:thermonuclease family protein [Metabacillus sp. 113a]|uniref:thermonuclease family protein n=1 Tax=Metabacillus sp. 113a TaxID=3404706 RepID=UPI003CF2C94C